MIELLEIKDFIQKIAEGITLALEIDTQIIDRYCNRIAGTVIQPLPPVGGVVRTILQTGLQNGSDYTTYRRKRLDDSTCNTVAVAVNNLGVDFEGKSNAFSNFLNKVFNFQQFDHRKYVSRLKRILFLFVIVTDTYNYRIA